MALSGYYTCLKYFVFIVNLVFWLLGLLVLGVALWFYFDSIQYLRAIDEYNAHGYYTGTYVLMGTGALMVIVGFLGCCGAFRESQCMLGSFFVFLLLIITAQIAGGVWAYLHGDTLKESVKKGFKESVKETYSIDQTTQEAVDFIQENMGCCGAEEPHDWIKTKFNNYKESDNFLGKLGDTIDEIGVPGKKYDFNIPGSCCNKDAVDECSDPIVIRQLAYTQNMPVEVYPEGCSDKFFQFLKSNMIYVISVAIGVAAIELLGVILSLVLCCAIRRVEQFKA